jgi:integrase
VLSLEEARLVYRVAGSLGYPFGPIYRLLLLTGCRSGEWSGCLGSFVDLEQALLVLPAQHYKSDHLHVVPLVPQAVEILREVFAAVPRSPDKYIFSGTGGAKPVVGWPKVHARMLKEICAETGERVSNRWTPHDLRRTVATRLAETLGVGGEQMIRRVLGHSDGSVTAIYNRYGYVKEMRAVLNQWATELTGDSAVQSAQQLGVPKQAPAAQVSNPLDFAA